MEKRPKVEFLADPDKNLYGDILASIFVPHISSIENQNPQIFIDCLRIFEANNFQLVEAIQAAENQIESILRERKIKSEQSLATVHTLENNLE